MNSPYGQIAWWGFSPSLDLIEYMKAHEVEVENNKELNILLVGSADGRHVLQTMSKFHKHTGTVNFYIAESSLENIARQVLLINLALETADKISPEEKVEMFLELFGNSLLRTVTEQYLVERSNDFIKMITDPTQAENNFPLFDFTNLKYKERDQLEAIFKFWRNEDKELFDVRKHWESRVRNLLGTRYDARENAFDWEYSMNLKEKSSVINWHEYKRWRNSGLAFEIRDKTAYEVPNKTLASGLVFRKDGEMLPKRGYWGDIMNSPYISFGTKSVNDFLFLKNNGVHVKTSTDVSTYNIKSYLHQLVMGEEYTSSEESDDVTITELQDSEKVSNSRGNQGMFPNLRLIFLPLESVKSLHTKSKFKRRFDMVFFSNSMVHCLDTSLGALFHDKQSILVIESTKYMLDVKAEIHEEYKKKIEVLASSAKCVSCKTFDAEKDEFAVFKFQGE